ncbi:MAG: PepSY-associated TM helix domain-containing protein [Sphingomonas bacterium]
MRAASVRSWQFVHKWSSLVCTAFLLLICVTGLPLIFMQEIGDLTERTPAYAIVPPGTPALSLDRLAVRAKQVFPGQIVTSILIDDDEPQVFVWMAPSFAAVERDPAVEHFIRLDTHDGRVLERPRPPGQGDADVMTVMLRLHTDLFAGLPGELFLGAMALLFVTAIVSGVVLYGPFTRKLDFGAVRTRRSRRVRWLDLHNLLGIVTLAWALVVGVTGAMNELSTPLFALWQRTDVAAMLAPWQGKAPPRRDEVSSPQAALETATRALPGMVVTSIAFPGERTGSSYHYLLWAHGKTPLTAQLFSPVLVDARTGALTAVVRMPWYLRALEISRPLHFGNYGGLPLKVIWALLDLATIVVLGSGLYLWLGKGRHAPARPVHHLAERLEAAE